MIYKKPTFEFHSAFAPHIYDYVELRESLGAKFSVPSGILRQFDRYCVSLNVSEPLLTKELAGDWLASKREESASSHSRRISCLKCFADYLSSIGLQVSWTPHPGYAGRQNRYAPYIYSEDEIRHFFASADSLQKPIGRSMFHLVFPCVIKMLYCCGLRVSEALALRVKDVDLENGLIYVEHAKLDNCRRLPVSESMLSVLRDYSQANKLIGTNGDGFFFPNANGEQYSHRTVYDKFREVLWASGIPHQGRGKGPRVHDFRHTFAVRSLRKGILEGHDPYVWLPALMSYLGHSKLSSTEYYLRLTADVFPDFLETADSVCAVVIPEAVSYED